MAEPAITIESDEVERPPIDLDAQPVTKTAEKPEPKVEKAAQPSLEDEIRAYRQQMIAKDQQIRAEEQQRLQAQREAFEARNQATYGQYHMLRSQTQAVEAEMAKVKQNLETAWQSGDFKAASDLQEALATLAAERTQFRMAVSSMEEQHKAQQQQPVQQQRQPQPQLSDDERYLATIPDPRTRDWLRSHPDCLPSGGLHRAVNAAHWDALNKNIPQGSDEYWRHVETATGYREAPVSVNNSRRAAPSAPPSRSTPGYNGQQKQNGSRTLSQSEYDMAQHPPFNGDLEEYWKQKQGAIKDGNYYKPFNMPD